MMTATPHGLWLSRSEHSRFVPDRWH